MSEPEKIRCSFAGCHRSIPRRSYVVPPEGWVCLSGWGPGIQDGFYCKPHADAIEALNDSGELEQIQTGEGA
jgi:hypothetical protein